MRTQTIHLALTIVLFCMSGVAQMEQTSGLRDECVPHLSVTGTNMFPNAPHQFPTDKFTRDALKRSTSPIRKTLSAQSQIYVIDTAIVWSLGNGVSNLGDTARHLYSFNADGERTSDLAQKLTGGRWVDTLRQTNTYDASSNMLSELYEKWVNGQWQDTTRSTYTVDANGYRLCMVVEVWVNGQWQNFYRKTYTYDGSGNQLSDLYEYWLNDRWYSLWCYTYTYDENGNQLSKWYGQWGGDHWMDAWRYTYTYDAKGNRLTELYEEPIDGAQWGKRWRGTYTYDADGNNLCYLVEYWVDSQWVISQRKTYTYDAKGSRLTELYEFVENGQWRNAYISTYTYDVGGNMLTWLLEYWAADQLVKGYLETHKYDAHGNLVSAWFNTWRDSSWTPMEYYGTGDGFGVIDGAGNYYSYIGYTFTLSYKLPSRSISLGIAPDKRTAPATPFLDQNYPNPFNPTTEIQFTIINRRLTIVKVYDVLGRDVATLVNEVKEPGAYTVEFDGSNLASGVYLYRLQVRPLDSAIGRDSKSGAGDFVQTRKLLLLR